MQRFEDLQDTVKYIQNKHKHINRVKGVYGYKFLKRHNGSRIPFEEVNGLTIKQIDVIDSRSLIIDLCCCGYEFKKQSLVNFSSRLFLNELAVINVYDHKTEFFSFNAVDFVYLEINTDSKLQLFQEWILKEPGVIRAQWTARIPEIDSVLEEVGQNRRIKIESEQYRPLDMTCDIF